MRRMNSDPPIDLRLNILLALPADPLVDGVINPGCCVEELPDDRKEAGRAIIDGTSFRETS